jgi:hypothetical protein
MRIAYASLTYTNLGRIYHASRQNFEKCAGSISAAATAAEECGGPQRRHQVKVSLPALLLMLTYILWLPACSEGHAAFALHCGID